jgi:hypothetical protein
VLHDPSALPQSASAASTDTGSALTSPTGGPAGEPTSPSSTTADAVPTEPTEQHSAPPPEPAAHTFTVAFAGDVHFVERTADRLAEDPATAFGVAAASLSRADLTVVNLETAIATGGSPEPKSYTFRAPPVAFDALWAAGADVASMANNHAADYGATGVQESLDAISATQFPVVGFGTTAAEAYAPVRRTLNGVEVAIFAASAVRDHTLTVWSATATTPGFANDSRRPVPRRSSARTHTSCRAPDGVPTASMSPTDCRTTFGGAHSTTLRTTTAC